MNELKYTVIIQWSEEDQVYVVSLPEWGPYCKTHGETYEEAAKNAREVLEMLVANHEAGHPQNQPVPKLFHYPGADVIDIATGADAKSETAATMR
jgi:antitoxin HicB